EARGSSELRPAATGGRSSEEPRASHTDTAGGVTAPKQEEAPPALKVPVCPSVSAWSAVAYSSPLALPRTRTAALTAWRCCTPPRRTRRARCATRRLRIRRRLKNWLRSSARRYRLAWMHLARAVPCVLAIRFRGRREAGASETRLRASGGRVGAMPGSPD